MKIRVSSAGNIQLEEIYNPIELLADKEALVICQCDGIFEIRPLRDSIAKQTLSQRPMYLLFVGEGHRPDGGKWGLTGVFKTLAAAQDVVDHDSWAHTLIVGSNTLELVAVNRAEGGLINSSWLEGAT